MTSATIQLIAKLAETFIPLLFSMGRGEDARELQKLYDEAKGNWSELEQWGNSPTMPPKGQPPDFR
jgi:hypothetical protein